MPQTDERKPLDVRVGGDCHLKMAYSTTGYWIEFDLVDTHLEASFRMDDADTCREVAAALLAAADWLEGLGS